MDTRPTYSSKHLGLIVYSCSLFPHPENVSYVHLIALFFRCKFSIKCVELARNDSRTRVNQRKVLLYNNVGRISWSVNCREHRKRLRNAHGRVRRERVNCAKRCFEIFRQAGVGSEWNRLPCANKSKGHAPPPPPSSSAGRGTQHAAASVPHGYAAPKRSLIKSVTSLTVSPTAQGGGQVNTSHSEASVQSYSKHMKPACECVCVCVEPSEP